MHNIEVSEGVVLGKRGVGEANTLVFVLTKDYGLLRASARSARLGASKLRYGLEPLTRGRYSFVRGRREWRLVQVNDPRSLIEPATPRAARAALGRVSALVLRLVAGEEPNEALFKDVVGGLNLLASQEATSIESIEVVLVLRILSHLGYLPHTEALAPFIAEEFSLELSAKALAERSLLVRAINESLRHTGL